MPILPIIRFIAINMILLASARGAAAAESNKAQAPPNYAILKNTRGGAVFVPKALKDQYDVVRYRVEKLRADLAADKVEPRAVLEELRQLETKLDELRKLIEDEKLLISPFKVQQQTEEFLFDLGPERMLVITADHIKVVGWDGPQVKCVLEKSLLATGDAPETEEFKAMKIVHKHEIAQGLVGKTDAEWEAEETDYLAKQTEKPTEKALAARRRFIQEIRDSYAPYRDFQGRQIDAISIHGLTHEEGNRHITVEVSSKGGGSSMGGDWRRDARLTVHVPSSKGVLLRGCLGSLDVKGLKAPLVVSDSGSRDRDYEGEFVIQDHNGPLTVRNVPLDRLERVSGDVRIISTVELLNTGTRHEGGQRIAYTPPARHCVVNEIEGKFSAQFSRSALTATGVLGAIDISNDFGDTRFVSSGPLANAAHRIVSQSGRIEVLLESAHVGKLPLAALTNHGDVHLTPGKLTMEDKSFTTGSPDGARRNWRGFVTQQKDQRFMDMDAFARPEAALAGEARAPGLDLISRSGNVILTAVK